MKELKNRDKVIDMIAETMRELDKDACDFQIDIYLYIDEDGNGEIETFSNPGGNSWRDDDHITVYSDGPHYDDYFETEIDGEPKDWDDLSDEEKEEFLPDMDDYQERAIYYLDKAIEEERKNSIPFNPF